MSTGEPGPLPTVRFARRSTRGVILGLSAPRCASIGAAVAVVVIGMLAAGAAGLVATAMLWAPLLSAAFVSWRDQPLAEWAPLACQWWARRSTGQTRYRARTGSPRPAGTLFLPGDAAALRFFDDPDSGACMVHDPHRRTLTAVAAVSHPAYVLLSPDEQRSRVYSWGRVLASLAHTGTCAAVQVLERTVPDPGRGVAGWYDTHGTGAPDWPNRQYRQLLACAGGSLTHRTTISIAVHVRRAGRAVRSTAGGITAAAAVLRSEMAGLEHSLRAAELRVEGWLDSPAVAVLARHAYDPAAEVDPDGPGARLDSAGPVGIDEHWSWFRHDSGYSTVLWISDWPRIEVPAHFLHALVFAPLRKTISIVARPIGTAEALKQIRKEKTASLTDSAHKARVGQVADAADTQEYHDILAREQALISGHGDVAFSGLIAITATSRDELGEAVSQLERSASQCACETRVLFGAQTQAFVAAALPFARPVS